MHRFYADGPITPDGMVSLAPEDARHALRVLRMKDGDALELFLDEMRYAAVLDATDSAAPRCRILHELPSTEARLRLTLYQGLPKADKMELIVQKAVELGADRVTPVAMSRCVVQLDAKDGAKKQERWQKIAREACKQSGRCRMMDVSMPISFKEMLRRLPEHDGALVPWEDAKGYSLAQFHREHPQIHSLAVVIGPEGGMSAEEVAAMEASGACPVTLGPRILRTETAGLSAMAALLCLYGDME